MPIPITSTVPSIEELRQEVRGPVISPGDAGYDAARTPFVGGIDKHPAAIVKVADAADVSRVVVLARERGTELAVRSGGHSSAGHSVSEGGIVIDLGDMRALEIDVDGRTAWAETGLTAAEYTATAGEHGLATGFGDTGSVGIGGITLGGGIGFLSRRYGLTIDDLLGAEVVTADGQVRHVDAESHPDLFWAIRGGGGNFGVATRFHLRLHEVGTVLGGMLFLPASPDVVAGFVEAAHAAPDELTTIANVMTAPPMPFTPEEFHGQTIAMAMMTYAGDVEAGERVVAPFRSLATPIADMLRPMPYPEMYQPEDEDYHPDAAVHNGFVDTIGRSDAEAILDGLEASTASLRVAQLRVHGGAIARVPDDATAFAHRSELIMVNIAAFVDAEDRRAATEAWVADLAGTLHGDGGAAYVNFMRDEGEARVRAAYPGKTWDRLAEIKTRYDPTNLFRLNQNVPPSGG